SRYVTTHNLHSFPTRRSSDLVINVDDSERLTKISDHDEADNQPRWSPDGKWIAFTGEVHERDHPKIWLAPATGGAASVLAANGRSEEHTSELQSQSNLVCRLL